MRMRVWLAAAALCLSAPLAWAQDGAGGALARANETPRHAASNQAATRAVAICSGLWSGNQTMAMIERDNRGVGKDFKTEIDHVNKTVSVTYDAAMPPRIVVWRNVMGCVQLPVGATMDAASTLPQVDAALKTPNFDKQAWPMGDRGAVVKLPTAQQKALDAIVLAAFDGKTYAGANTWGVIVVKDGKIVAERYANGYGPHIGGQTHSAAKSFASTLAGIATKKYALDIKKPGALQEWRAPGDPRGAITVEHLLHMSSGLYGEAGGSPQQDIYFQGATVAGRAATNMLDTKPGTRFLYNPPDTMLLMRAVRQAVNDDKRFFAYPYTDLFWKIGMTRTVSAGEWNGDFLMSGQSYSTARDFARFGLLYINDGVWNGERILPEGWAKYVQTPGPVQPAGNGPRYGAQFWLHGGLSGLPTDAYTPAGGQGQYAMIIPSRGVIVVRRGYDSGAGFQIAKFSADVLKAVGKP